MKAVEFVNGLASAVYLCGSQSKAVLPDPTRSATRMSSPAVLPLDSFVNLEELEELAKLKLTKMAFDYYAGGANTQQSVRDNRSSFANYRILPRILIDVSSVDTNCSMFGEQGVLLHIYQFLLTIWPTSAFCCHLATSYLACCQPGPATDVPHKHLDCQAWHLLSRAAQVIR